jgi:ribosomal protein S18 acetylase RimI-like enzyme
VAARGGNGLLGAIVCVPLRGAGALVWPPQVVHDPRQVTIEDLLLGHALTWLRGRGTRVAQALLAAEELPFAAALTRNSFTRVTSLLYLRHPLTALDMRARAESGLIYQTYNQDPVLFQNTLLRTYEGTLDCPELNGVRNVAEIIDGHQAQGNWDPERWWLVWKAQVPVGVLLVAEVADAQGWDVAYLGVVPEARRQGIGQQLAEHALRAARSAGTPQLTLAVDARNYPAQRLYSRMGFEHVEHREVFLTILCSSARHERTVDQKNAAS